MAPSLSDVIDESMAFFHDIYINHALEGIYTCIYLAVKHGDGIVYGSDPLIHEHFLSLSFDVITFGCLHCGL